MILKKGDFENCWFLVAIVKFNGETVGYDISNYDGSHYYFDIGIEYLVANGVQFINAELVNDKVPYYRIPNSVKGTRIEPFERERIDMVFIEQGIIDVAPVKVSNKVRNVIVPKYPEQAPDKDHPYKDITGYKGLSKYNDSIGYMFKKLSSNGVLCKVTIERVSLSPEYDAIFWGYLKLYSGLSEECLVVSDAPIMNKPNDTAGLIAYSIGHETGSIYMYLIKNMQVQGQSFYEADMAWRITSKAKGGTGEWQPISVENTYEIKNQ